MLETPPFANEQEVFDAVVHHLAQQRKRAQYRTHGRSVCRYRDSRGCKCAIGGIIPDPVYDPSFEGQSVYALAEYAPFRALFEKRPPYALLSLLQRVHDGAPPRGWPAELRAVADERGLSAAAGDALVALWKSGHRGVCPVVPAVDNS